MLSLKLKNRLAHPGLLLLFPVTLPPQVLPNEQFEDGLSVPDSVFWGIPLSPNKSVVTLLPFALDWVNMFCTLPLGNVDPKEENEVP